jgi:protease I
MANVACLVGAEFEDSELAVPIQRLREAGHQVEILGTRAHEQLEGKRGSEKVTTDAAVDERRADQYDALLIPGGHSPDKLRMEPRIVRFVRDFAATGRPIAAICHGPQLLIEAGLVEGVRMTSWPSVRTDLRNAGAQFVDDQVVEDGQFITSRKPQDLEAFSKALLGRLESVLWNEPVGAEEARAP